MPRGLRSIAMLLALLAGACSQAPEPPEAEPVLSGPPDPRPRLAKPKPRGHYKVGEPYRIRGVLYTPEVDYRYDATGEASWYGPNFHGKLTANGELFDENDLTAAHTTLPLPSVIRVTNLDNGRALTLRVNDRGPFIAGRILDVSKKAAKMLGFFRAGLARVRVQVLEKESRALAAKYGVKHPPAAEAESQSETTTLKPTS